jgi:hypothetical protein
MSCAAPAGKRPSVDVKQQVSKSADLVEMRNQWHEKGRAFDRQSKDYPSRKLDLLLSLLKDAPAQQIDAEAERLQRLPDDYADLSDFDQTEVQAFVTLFAAEEKPTRLIQLIAAECPRSIGAEPVELYLARLDRSGGIVMLFDSYEVAVREEPRKSIIAILRRTFRSFSVRYADDNEFAGAAKRWYLTNKNGLRVNPYYHPDALVPENQQLFVAK